MIFDAHTHLFGRWYYAALWKQKHGSEPGDQDLFCMLKHAGLVLPPTDPAEHAAMIVNQMRGHGVDRAVLFTSLPGEQFAVAAACRASSGRLIGYTMVNPRAADALNLARRDLTDLGLRGIELFPAMHRFDPSDESLAYPFYELAAKLGSPVFVHVGLLRVKLREKLGLACPYDMRYSDPLRLHRAAADHPKVNFILPHFGCGHLREAAMLGAACANVHIDTSSSNDWMKLMPEPLTLERALAVCLEAFGPDRILFGTDSSVLPRGYRYDVKESLELAMEAVELGAEERGKIMGGNLAKLLRMNDE